LKISRTIWRRVVIHDEAVFILRVLYVAENGKRTDELAALAFDIELAADFHGYISAIGFVYEILERHNKIIGGVSALKAVIIIIYCNKADAEKRENLFNVLTGVEIVTPEPGEVLYDDAVGLASLTSSSMALKAGRSKVEPRNRRLPGHCTRAAPGALSDIRAEARAGR
jgi:hypothetical protein